MIRPLALLAATAGIVLASCSDVAVPAVGSVVVDGRVEVAGDGDTRVLGPGEHGVRAGQALTVVDGSARIGVAAGSVLELAAGASVRVLGSGPDGETRVELSEGRALLTTQGGSATVDSGGSTVTVAGAARISRSLALVVAVYEGTAEVASAGRLLAVPALRQVTLAAAGLLPARPSPLSFDPAEGWDRRYLGRAIDLGVELVSRSRAATAQLGPGEGTTPGFFRLLIPALETEPTLPELIDRARAPGETLVGAAIAAEGGSGSFPERWRQVFAFHDAGAAWGLVALDQGVGSSPLVDRVDFALGRLGGGGGGQISAAGEPPGSTPSGFGSVPAPTPVESSAPATPPAPDSPPGPGASTSGPVTVPGSPTEPIERVRGIELGVPAVDGTLNTLVATLGGLLRALSVP